MTTADRATGGIDSTVPEVVRGPEPQNPAPFGLLGQVDDARVRALADQIVSVFLNSLPSNYASTVGGPYYVQQFQAAAEELARIQVGAVDAYEDNDFDFTRSEVLFQFLATLVFPDAPTEGLPNLPGDTTFRAFLKRMVALLLRGPKATTLLDGLDTLTDAEVTLLQRVNFIGDPGVAWDLSDQTTVDVEVSKHRRTGPTTAMSVTTHYHPVTVDNGGNGVTGSPVYVGTGPNHTHEIKDYAVGTAAGTGQADHTHTLWSTFADLPLTLQANAAKVLRALGPAHLLYNYRNVFRDAVRGFSDRLLRVDLSSYQYEDFRKDCAGFAGFAGVGTVPSDRYTLSDPTRNFGRVPVGAKVTVASGPNRGVYTVTAVVALPFPDDPSGPYPYTTSPTGLHGNATVTGGAITDLGQNFGLCVPGERFTFTRGPNTGTYLLSTLLGATGGPVGIPTGVSGTIGPATSVRPAPSSVLVRPRFPIATTGVAYTVTVDRLGVQPLRVVTGENVTGQFLSPGSPVGTIQTANGPLVHDDGTPASRFDVVVRYDGTPVTVDDVNPYTGQIFLATPITTFLPGAHSVTVDYKWVFGGTFAFTGLNNPGLTLNRWDIRRGHGAVSPPGTWLGGTRTSRYTLGLALSPGRGPRGPVRVAHRFLGYERAYTSALNSPTTLRLNNPPGLFTTASATADLPTPTVVYEPTAVPETPWVRVGSFTGAITESGTYRLTKSSTTSVGYWSSDFPVPGSTEVGVAARLKVNTTDAVGDGVFTGVGMGFHDNRHLYFAGALRVPNPVTGVALQHLGILRTPGNLGSVDSWVVGPGAEGTIRGPLGTNVVTFDATTTPNLLGVGDRFQILDGGQTGVYTVTDLHLEAGVLTAIVSPAFPGDPGLYGNRVVTAVFEVGWDAGAATWRLYANTRTARTTLFFGGALGGVLSFTTTGLATPADLFPDVPPEGFGRALWGVISRSATVTSEWSLVRATATPDGYGRNTRGAVTDVGNDPEGSGWYRSTPFGSTVTLSGGVTLTGTAAANGLGTTYGYTYLDPTLNGKRVAALDAKVTVQRDTAGVGGAMLLLRNGQKDIRLATLRYWEAGPGVRAIYTSPTVTLVGSTGYNAQGWSAVTGSPAVYANGHETTLTGGTWEINTPFTTGTHDNGLFLEFTLSMVGATLGTGHRAGLSFRTTILGRSVALDFRGVDTVVLSRTPTGSAIATYPVPWSNDTVTVRVEYDGVSHVHVYVGNVEVGTAVALALFPINPFVGVSVVAEPDVGSSFSAELFALCQGGIPDPTGLGHTFGLWKGGDPTNINNWLIPRSDSTGRPNSDNVAAIPVVMDWSTECWVRLFLDPTFGVGFIRPDLAPPPGYTGDFATQSMDPSASWVSIGYSDLPRLSSTFGSVAFGKWNPASSSIATWKGVQYRTFTSTTGDYVAPRRMVLGRQNVVNSGDRLLDKTPEVVTIAARTTTQVNLRDCDTFADRVFVVVVDDTVLPMGSWSFDPDTQMVTLVNPLRTVGYPVTVTFAAGTPVTVTYLRTQPLAESQTILNEGTPPVPRGQVGGFTMSTLSADGGPTPAFPPAGPSDPHYFLRDPYLSRQPSVDPGLLYEQLTFVEIRDGGSTGTLSPFCDGFRPVEMSLSGAFFGEYLLGASPTDMWSIPPSGTLSFSGGLAPIGGVWGPGDLGAPGLPLYPTYSGGGVVVPGSGLGAIHRELLWDIAIRPLFETLNPGSDRYYPSAGPDPISPSATGSVKGTAWYRLEVLDPPSVVVGTL